MDRETSSGHSLLKPSAAGRWVHCPGSVSLEAAFPSKDSSHNLEGHITHGIAAAMLRGATCAVPNVGAVIYNGVAVTQEMHAAAELYVEDILRTVPDYGPGNVLVEVERPTKVMPVHPLCFGTPDCCMYDSVTNSLYIWDLKFGYGIVEPEDNWQLITYAAGIIHELGISDIGLTLHLRIIQPRAYHPEGPIREWCISAVEIRPYVNKLHYAAHLALEPGQHETLKSGIHCRYCSGRHACQALREAAYYSVDISGRLEIEEPTSDALGREYKLLQEAADRIAYRLTGVEAQVRARTEAGDLTTGYRIESALGRLSWDKSVNEVLVLGDLVEKDLRKSPEPVTPAQAIKVGISKEIIEKFSSRKPTAPKLVPSNQTLASQAFKKEEGNVS